MPHCLTAGTLDSVRALLPRELQAVVLFIQVKPLGLQQNGSGEERTNREACGTWQDSSELLSGTRFHGTLSSHPWSDSPWILWYCLIYMCANRLLMYLKLGWCSKDAIIPLKWAFWRLYLVLFLLANLQVPLSARAIFLMPIKLDISINQLLKFSFFLVLNGHLFTLQLRVFGISTFSYLSEKKVCFLFPQ